MNARRNSLIASIGVGVVAIILTVITTYSPVTASPRFYEWSAPVNLGPVINSAFNDIGPALSKDGLSLYFYSNRPGGFGGLDIWVSQRASDEDAGGSPINLGPVINTSATEGVPSFSRDEHWMFFNSNRTGGFGSTDIWVSWRPQTHDDFGWQTPVNLGPGVNSVGGDSNATFFANEEGSAPLVFFGSNRLGGPGAGDVYYSAWVDGTFGPATLVAELSSPQPDMGGTIRFDGLEFIQFSSRNGSLGNFDLWGSIRKSTSDIWSTPENLGAIVNSVSNELTPHVSPDGRLLIFGSDRPGGFGAVDLYVSTRERINGKQDR